MNDAPSNIGLIIKSVRQEMDISLDKASKLTGVSKAMLGQIERGESSPTVSTLWKISSGLRITFSRLLSSPAADYRVTDLDEINPVYEDGGRMILRNIFPFDPIIGFDYLHITLKPGCSYESPSHSNVLEEFVVVTKGEIELTIDGRVYNLKEDSSIRFKGDASHIYANPYGEEAIFQNIMKY